MRTACGIASIGLALLIEPVTASPSAHHTARTGITFFVYSHSKSGQIVGLEGVRVSRVGLDGEGVLGTTDGRGRIHVGEPDLSRPGQLALLFCGSQFPELCTALRLDTDLLRGFEEWNVQLPPFELIDRAVVNPK